MEPLLTSEQMRSADLFAIEKIGIPAVVLMEHAAVAVVDRLAARFSRLLPNTKGMIFAGGGNNGGDAIAVGRLLYQRGIQNFSIVLVGGKSSLSPLAKEQLHIAEKLGITFENSLKKEDLDTCDWVIDGIFGTGLSRPIEGDKKQIIEAINAFAGKLWIVSIDLPSGLSADSGRALPVAIRASETVSLGFYKRGLVTGEAGNFVGRLSLAPIQIPRDCAASAGAFLYTLEDAKQVQRRPKASHKGSFGHVYVWGGREDKEGACVIASLGALRSGAGLVTVLGSKELRHRLPVECMISEFDPSQTLRKEKGVFVLGPGMGTDATAWKVLQGFLESTQALVLDADALTLIASNHDVALRLLKKRAGEGATTLFTPHPKEAARLLASTVEAVESDRYKAVEELVQKCPGIFLLKGKGTLIKEKTSPTWVVMEGNSGLSKGGSGDLLSGIIGGFLAQGLEPLKAVAIACYSHGRASELVSQKQGTERAVIPTELADALKDVFQEVSI